ncbi:MAG: ABC transporter permease [Oscillospiraceae bacterium]|nr:ABC transporter permease [Oscillospiraceae bacterium]
MNLRQAIKMAWKSIVGNKGRSILTMLGIIIGIASVMTIVTVINGMNKVSMQYYEAMGNNRVNVSASVWNGRDIFDELYSYCNGLGSDLVLGVTPNSQFSASVVYGSKSSTAMEKNQESFWNNYSGGDVDTSIALPPTLYLGSDQYAVCNNFQLERGRDLSYLDVKDYHQVCVLGARAAKNFFNYADPIGQEIMVNGLPFTVIGLYKEKDATSAWSMDNMIVFPYTMSRYLAPGTQITEFVVKASSSDATVEATSRLIGYLGGVIREGEGYSSVYSDNQWQQSSNEYATMMSLVLGGIAAISLLVGGIGIMNIMLVTVTERTREIGIRRAIGAPRRSIVVQFLIEAAMLCGIGGIIGILFGAGGSLVAGKLLLKMIIYPAAGITMGAFLLSVALGIIFGIYPAAKASRLQPVEALRAD